MSNDVIIWAIVKLKPSTNGPASSRKVHASRKKKNLLRKNILYFIGQ